ncbi:hypothetical protein LB506_001239 [Fusarium annulatum]|nr:hypothetical protein LB506_001239 [Fusarium annulatum]
MGFPSNTASNAVIYVTYALFLLMGTGIAWKMRHQSKADFLSGNGTQTGQKIPSHEVSNNTEHRLTTGTAFPLALNFIASGE